MQALNDSLSESFRLLDVSVRDLCSYGRRCLDAKLKPELRRRYNFSELQLGFAKFGDFLRAAERAGVIKMAYTVGGDLEIWPGRPHPSLSPYRSGTANLPVPPQRTNLEESAFSSSTFSLPIRVRDDLWNAFNSFSAQWVYDRNIDSARRLPDGGQAEIGPDLIRIPSGRERTLEWMRSFSRTQDATREARLLAVLAGDSPVYRFKAAVNADPSVNRAWRRYHIQQVVADIEAWAASNGVHPKDVTSPFRRVQSTLPVGPSPMTQTAPLATQSLSTLETALKPLTQPAPQAPSSSPSLTPRLAALIDELIDELLRLRGTLQVMEPRG
jgi:hypothetical protein